MAAIWVTIAVALVLAAAVSFGALRLSEERRGPVLAFGLFMLAAVLAIVAIASVTFFRKTVGT